MDREGREIVRDLTKAVNRVAQANEDLLEIARREEMVQVERGPSVCPGCGKLNPTITQLDAEGSGPLDEFVMKAETHCCNKVVYGIADGWLVVGHIDEAASLLELKKGGNHG